MYLAPATLEETVRLLDEPENIPAVGDMVETERVLMKNPLCLQGENGGGGGSRTLSTLFL